MTPARRVVLTTWGSYGDLFPYFALAIRLKGLGHAPVLVTCAYYRDTIEQAGIEFQPLSPDVDPGDAALLARAMDPWRGSAVIVRELIVPYVRQAFDEIRHASVGADLIVSHPATIATPLVARATGARWLSSVLAPASIFSAHDFPLVPPRAEIGRLARASPWLARAFVGIAKRATASWIRPVRELASDLGQAPAAHALFEGQFSPFGTLALFSSMFGPPQRDWPTHTAVTGFVFHDDTRALDDDLRAFLDAGDPPIVFTLGSSAVGAPGRFYEESARAIAHLGRRAVMLVGRAAEQDPPPSWPGDIFVSAYAPHAPLFARAAAIVHHGGVGTTAQALRAGKPTLVVPHAHDQPDNAARAQRLGVARVLDARRYRAAAVARHLARLLDEAEYGRRGAAVGRAIAAERGCEEACAAILAACGD